MKILITGAAGFLGKSLIERLHSENYSLRALIRQESRKDLLKPFINDFFVGDLTLPETLSGCAEDIDTIIHVAGKLGEFGVSEEIYHSIHVHGTKNILKEGLKAGIKHFIHTSSAGVLGPISKCPADESFPLNPSNIYEHTKCEAEKLVVQYCGKNDIDYTILRPEFVYGPGDLHVLGLFRGIKSGMFFLIGKGETYLHPTYIESVTESYILSLKNQERQNCFLITGDRAVTVKELVKIIADKLGVAPPKFSIPLKAAFLGAKILEKAWPPLNVSVPLSVSAVKFFSENRSFDSRLAKEKLDYKPKVTLEEGIEKTISWYREKGYL